MKSGRFDALARMLRRGGSRRQALRLLVSGSLLAGEVRTTTQDLELDAAPPQRDLPQPGDDRYPPDEVPLLVIPAGSTVILAPGGSVWGYTDVAYQGVTGWVEEEYLR
jgi:hypothetical protein